MILHRLHDLPVVVGADDPGHGSDHEDLARLGNYDPPIAVEADDLGHGSDHEDLGRLGKGHGAQKR